ncbi:MAG TPA: glycosyltransferase family 4 protein [Anaeromyxobacteraceae bacterium]|nr:glycosyltransferase family 4 protein [Anaeromyxobacteraceae bacterium]
MEASRSPAILQVADYGGNYSGNFVASLRALSDPCRSLGLRLAFAFSRLSEEPPFIRTLREEGFPVYLLDRAATLLDRVRALTELAGEANATLLHTHFARYDVPAALAAIHRRRPLSVVWHAHSPMPKNLSVNSVAKEAIKMRVLGRSVHLAAVSPAILDEAIGNGFPVSRAHHIPNAVDVQRATAREIGRNETRRRLAIPPGAPTVLTFGWDPLRKGIDVALDAIASLWAGESGPFLLVIGGHELHAFLHARWRGTTPTWVRVLPLREHVGDLYAAADVFVSASRAEGFPYALGEAVANGMPILASHIPGCEWVREIEGARFVPPGDAVSLARALREAIRLSPERRAHIRRAQRAYAAEHLSLSAWAQRVAGVYRESLAGMIPLSGKRLKPARPISA